MMHLHHPSSSNTELLFCEKWTLGSALLFVVTVFSGLADGSWLDNIPELKLVDK
jgi:hypothetical protein